MPSIMRISTLHEEYPRTITQSYETQNACRPEKEDMVGKEGLSSHVTMPPE